MRFLIYFMCITSFLSAQQYELSICTIFRDDAEYLPEWIDFHRSQGVEHFYLYNNLSKDHPEDLLRHYLRGGSVTLIDWPYESTGQEDWNKIQCASYAHCVQKYGHKTKWVAFLDTDEFLFCPNAWDLRAFLRQCKGYKAISAKWMMYGTSNLTIPYGGNIVDYLVYRAKDDFAGNEIVKTIAQPKYIHDITNPHFVTLTNGHKQMTFEHEKIRINHYWSRDLSFFYTVKLARREKWYGDRQMQIDMESHMNEIYDPILRNR